MIGTQYPEGIQCFQISFFVKTVSNMHSREITCMRNTMDMLCPAHVFGALQKTKLLHHAMLNLLFPTPGVLIVLNNNQGGWWGRTTESCISYYKISNANNPLYWRCAATCNALNSVSTICIYFQFWSQSASYATHQYWATWKALQTAWQSDPFHALNETMP